jgi:hypothetical protein
MGRAIEALCEQWPSVLPKLQAELLEGTYRPGVIRRAYIPKSGGGQRGLGIPDVIDGVVCEAVRQVLEPLWEPTFHPSSHGFRPGRSCHTATTEARGHLEDGYEWCERPAAARADRKDAQGQGGAAGRRGDRQRAGRSARLAALAVALQHRAGRARSRARRREWTA